MTGEMHDFMLRGDGSLSSTVEDIPTIREHIEELPPTSATFKPKQIDGLNGRRATEAAVEFCGAWRLPDAYSSSRGVSYVNPNYEHAHRYTDMLTRCECGATIAYTYETEFTPLENSHEHTDECQPYHRLRARADVLEQRHKEILRLSKLGWRGTDMAPRMGTTKDSMGALARDLGLGLWPLYDDYRERAANTYKHLVHEQGEPADKIATIYGHDKSTLGRWANDEHTYAASQRGDE